MSMSNIRHIRLILLSLIFCLGASALAQGTGPRVIIDSSPPGAAVYVDGKQNGVQGYTSGTFKIRLNRGPHRVLLELDGYKPVEQVINVNQAQKFTFTLERAPARLDIKTPGTNESARGGEVFIDGAPAGMVPVPVEVPSGRHLVEVRKTGYRVYSETVELRAGDVRTLWVTLNGEVRNGALLVAADANADVFVDGQPRGAVPVLVDNLPEGDHLVEVRRTEPGAPPWRQNVRVLAGQQVKVMAQTHGAAPATGSLLVTTNATDVEVAVDGTTKGKANQEIAGLRPGQHVVVIRGKNSAPVNKVVDIEAGKQRVLPVELVANADVRGVGIVRVIMVNPVEAAQYFINGRKYDEAAILSEKGVEVQAGPSILVVRRDGFGEARRDLTVRPGGVETVTVDLRNVGKIFIASDPRGATVLLDNMPVGQTPYTAQDVAAGPHQVELRMPDRPPFTQQVVVRGGEQVNINAALPGAAAVVAPPPDPALARRGLSSFSAVTIEPGMFTTDVGLGYPYFFNVRLTVGAVRKGWFGLDAGAELRSNFYMTDVGLNLRAQLARFGPIAIGANLMIGGGGGPRQRNEFILEAGVPVTLLAGNLVKLTVRPYLQVYSDQLCPSGEYLDKLVARNDIALLSSLVRAEHAGDRCTGGENDSPDINVKPGSGKGPYRNAIMDYTGYYETTATGMGGSTVIQGRLGGARSYDPNSPLYQTDDGNPVLSRFVGVRFMVQAVIEVAATQNTNLFLIFEGAPGQKERQAFTDKFNRVFPDRDFPIYGRIGFTMKF